MSFSPEELHTILQRRPEIDAAIRARTLSKHTQMADAQAFREVFGAAGRAVMELATAQAAVKHNGKLPHTWLMCNESMQQATAMPVAQYRARKIVEHGYAQAFDVTCSIGTEGAALTEQGLSYFGSDIDPVRVRMATHNVQEGHFIVADALQPAYREAGLGSVVIADPARRSNGRRIFSPEDLAPPLSAVQNAWRGAPMAVKCAPGINYTGWEGLVSVVSLNGSVKEACLYSPEFGTRREAVVLRDNHQEIWHSDMPAEAEVRPPGKYIIDPDGAVVRAGVVQQYAVAHGLWMLDEHIAYLSGERIPQGHSGFPFMQRVGLKQLKVALQALDCGALEILVRGVDVDPDLLRKKLKLKGRSQLAVVITRLGDDRVALICGPREFAA